MKLCPKVPEIEYLKANTQLVSGSIFFPCYLNNDKENWFFQVLLTPAPLNSRPFDSLKDKLRLLSSSPDPRVLFSMKLHLIFRNYSVTCHTVSIKGV